MTGSASVRIIQASRRIFESFFRGSLNSIIDAASNVRAQNQRNEIAMSSHFVLNSPFLVAPSKDIGKMPRNLATTKIGFTAVKIFSILNTQVNFCY